MEQQSTSERAGWAVETVGFDDKKIMENGTAFLLGNGSLGCRGTMEEYRKKQCPAVNLAGVYDRCGKKWRETVNAPNGLFTKLFCGGRAVSLPAAAPEEHVQRLDLRRALHFRRTVWNTPSGRVRVEAERFVSMDDPHLICLRYAAAADQSCRAEIVTGIDTDIWDLNGPHLLGARTKAEDGLLAYSAKTGELGIAVGAAEAVALAFDAEETVQNGPDGVFRRLSFETEPGREYVFFKFYCVFTAAEGEPEPLEAALRHARAAAALGYAACRERHAALWARLWARSDMVIEGDPEAQRAARYSVYHLLTLAPRHGEGASIAARGLSGQTYKGAVFWDTEMFLLPFYLYTDPDVARRLVAYRVKTLPGARRKAREYGFRGAFYAWESQETGDDACSDYNVTDVFSGRPMRTFFRDKQVHISADVAFAVWQVYSVLEDESVLLGGGAEVILECARFFYSYACYKPERGRFEIHDVIGPDEYHERVNNNAFTSRMALSTLEAAHRCVERLRKTHPEKLRALLEQLGIEKELPGFEAMRRSLFVPQPDPETGLIEQFDGYYRLEDCTLGEVRSRLLDPKEYWGGQSGVASGTQIIKQADVLFLLWLFRAEFSRDVLRANWRYYEPRTEHGSSLSPCVYALTACETGNPDWGYPYFLQSASIDLKGGGKQFAGSVYIGGSHPAASGGAWMVAAFGFAGLRFENGAPAVSPRLPRQWDRLEFPLFYRGERYRISITKTEARLWKEPNV